MVFSSLKTHLDKSSNCEFIKNLEVVSLEVVFDSSCGSCANFLNTVHKTLPALQCHFHRPIITNALFFKKDLIDRLIDWEKEGEREGDKYKLVAPLHTPYWGPGPQPRHVPWLGIKLATLWFGRLALNPLNHTTQGTNVFIDLRERETREREGETSICCATQLCLHWLLPVCALTRDRTLNLGVFGMSLQPTEVLARAQMCSFEK